MHDTLNTRHTTGPTGRRVVRFGEFRADLTDGTLWREGQEVAVPPRALALLLYLLERPGHLVSKTELLDAAWRDANVTETSLTEAVGILRQAIGDRAKAPRYIQTAHRRGYRFIAPLTWEIPPSGPRPALVTAAEVEGPTHAADAPAPAGPPYRRPLVLALGALAAAIALAYYGPGPGAGRAASAVTRTSITLPADQAPVLAYGAHPAITISPDGSQIVFVGGSLEAPQLFVRRMDQFDARPLPGTQDARNPFFSPDGQRVAFFADGHLKQVALAGGTPLQLAGAANAFGGTWTTAGTIVFTPAFGAGLWEVPEAGGAPVELFPPPAGRGYRWPHALPDGRTFIATRWGVTQEDAAVVALSRDGRVERELAHPAMFGRYAGGGQLLYLSGETLMAAPYHPGHTGPVAGRPLIDRVLTQDSGAGQYDLSASGALLYLPADPDRANRALVRMDARTREVRPSGHEPRPYANLAACGGRLALSIRERGLSDIWLADTEGGPLTRLTRTGTAMQPAWLPGCEDISYSSAADGLNSLYVMRADADATPRLIQRGTAPQAPEAWADAATLIYKEVQPGGPTNLWQLSVTDGRVAPVAATADSESDARFSPDGRWLAYMAFDGLRTETFVRPFGRPGGPAQVSSGGGGLPAWSADGRQLFYTAPAGLMALPFDPVRGAGAAAASRILPRTDIVRHAALDSGDLLLVTCLREREPLTTLNLVLNWRAEMAGHLAGLR